jgi:serine/threonine protein kinase
MNSNHTTILTFIGTLILLSQSKITDFCSDEAEFNRKFARELGGRTIAEAIQADRKQNAWMSSHANSLFKWIDHEEGETVVLMEAHSELSFRRKSLIFDIEHRVQLAGNPFVVPLIGCTEFKLPLNPNDDISMIVEFIVSFKPKADTLTSLISEPVFKTFHPIKKLGAFLGMAKAISSVHKAGIVHLDIRKENFKEINYKQQEAKLANFENAGVPGKPHGQTEDDAKNLPECRKGDCIASTSMDIYRFAFTILESLFSIPEIESNIFKVPIEFRAKASSTFEVYPEIIRVMSQSSPVLRYPNDTEDNIGKLLQQCLAVDPAARPSSEEVVTRLSAIFNRAMAKNADQLLESESKAYPIKSSSKASDRNIIYNGEDMDVDRHRKPSHSEQELDDGRNQNKSSESREQDHDSDSSLFRYVTVGGILILAVVVPIGFYLFKKSSA